MGRLYLDSDNIHGILHTLGTIPEYINVSWNRLISVTCKTLICKPKMSINYDLKYTVKDLRYVCQLVDTFSFWKKAVNEIEEKLKNGLMAMAQEELTVSSSFNLMFPPQL